jgi:HK97 family phage portal protein
VSLLGQLLGRQERDITSTLNAPSEWLREAITTGATYTGQTVSPEGSLSLVPVYSAVSLLAGSVGSLPLVVYRRLEQGRERAEDYVMWRILHDQPNTEMAADELWEMITGHLALWGNAFLAKFRNNLGVVGELYPISPKRVQVGRDTNGKRYFIVDGADRYDESDILHIRGFGTDPLVGLSPIQQARQMLGAVMSQEEFSGRFWANNAHPAGVLKHPNRLSQDSADRLKASWKASHGGPRNAGEVAVLEEGMTWEATGMPLEDAQFIQTAQWNDLRIAQLFRIPPYMIGAKSGDSMTYSNTEMQGIDFVRWSLRRWLIRIEKSLLRDESMFLQQTRFYPEFLVDGLLRADTKNRYESYAIALDPAKGWMTKDEVRDRENLNPLPEPAMSPDPEVQPTNA